MLIDLRVKHDVGAWGHPVVLFDFRHGLLGCLVRQQPPNSHRSHEAWPYTREGVLVLDLARWLLGEQVF